MSFLIFQGPILQLSTELPVYVNPSLFHRAAGILFGSKCVCARGLVTETETRNAAL